LGERYLAAEEKLSIEVLVIDLAGRTEPWHTPNFGVRYMRDVTWPRIKLRYTLERNDLITNAEESIADIPRPLRRAPRTALIPRQYHAPTAVRVIPY
jgi:hypothetical protein